MTSNSVRFLNNLFKWYPYIDSTRQRTLLEWGGGNSTIYFLQNKFKVFCCESSEEFIQDLNKLATIQGFSVEILEGNFSQLQSLELAADLTILPINAFDKTIHCDLIHGNDWDVIVNDGFAREQVMEQIVDKVSSILIVDNVEYAANWGHTLARSSAHESRIPKYRALFRNPDWNKILFEQGEGSGTKAYSDSTGWEAPHRWITGVFWHSSHLLSQHIITDIGFPLVTTEGLHDKDIETLNERCPFNWEKMEWEQSEYTNYFTLRRL